MLDPFLFDTLGYAVIRGAIGESAIRDANDAIDDLDLWHRTRSAGVESAVGRWRQTSDPVAKYVCPIGPGHLQAGPAAQWPAGISRLLEHPAVLAAMRQVYPAGHYLDHASLSLAKTGSCGIGLHGGAFERDPRQSYYWAGDHWDVGMCILIIALVPVTATMGGTALVPGSHKSNLPPASGFPAPQQFGRMPWIISPELAAGDLLVFPESVVHGAFPWRESWERRCLLAKYYPAHISNLHATRRGPAEPFWV
ncbi:MAG: hypothetical protein JWM19_5319 [Actinomycetia bacterium]|nr:hypothetical protein [Actinomycetes bacterium]